VRLVAPAGTTARDVQVAAAYFVGGLLLLAVSGGIHVLGLIEDAPRALLAGPLAVASAGIALRRLAPVAGLGLGLAGLLGDVALGGSLATILVFTQALYETCVYGPAWLWRWVLRVSVALTGVAAILGPLALGQWPGLGLAVVPVLVFVLPTITALTVRQYRDQAAADRARAEQTARLAELDRRQAVTAERNRMARELHDVIGNRLSAVAIHASALLSVKNLDPDTVERALRVIRENGVQGLAEMRQMVQLLRDPRGGVDADADSPTNARLAEAERLVAQVRDAGLAVEFAITGQPRPLPVSVDLAGYRILQESLANALKHGPGEARVAIAYEPDGVTLTVANPLPPGPTEGPRAGTGPSHDGSGHGLIGMRERADLLGGSFDAGPDGGTWRVHAYLPTREAER
jgi:signal transduction histidine kinase